MKTKTKKQFTAAILTFALIPGMIPATSASATKQPETTTLLMSEQSVKSPSGSHDEDVAALKALIAEQRRKGASVSENLDSEEQYVWENGRLTGITWYVCGLTGNLDVTGLGALTSLCCDCNKLTSLNVSENSALTYLSCFRNQLTSLDVSKNTALTELICAENKLTSLNVSNTALTELNCSENRLTSLDISKNASLKELFCYDNKLTSLDVSKNTALTYLICDGNQLTNLDIINIKNLKNFACDNTVTVIGYEGVTGFKLKNKGKGKIQAKWKKVSKAKSYQLQYSVSKKMKSIKTLTVKKSSLTVKNLKKGKKYYFRVRAYKKMDKKKNYIYGKWSREKSIKIKK